MLPGLGADEDIRVRFRAAVANSRLFTIARVVGQDPILLYDTIKRSLTLNILECALYSMLASYTLLTLFTLVMNMF
jgi:ataxia telangiectasia mutated family protein